MQLIIVLPFTYALSIYDYLLEAASQSSHHSAINVVSIGAFRSFHLIFNFFVICCKARPFILPIYSYHNVNKPAPVANLTIRPSKFLPRKDCRQSIFWLCRGGNRWLWHVVQAMGMPSRKFTFCCSSSVQIRMLHNYTEQTQKHLQFTCANFSLRIRIRRN